VTSPWFVRFEPLAEAKVRLFCLPYAGGGAAIHRGWQPALPEGVEVWSVRLPGRESRFREPALFRMSALVDALDEQFSTLSETPFAIFGHSLGALTGFELARRVERRGVAPGHLFVSAHRAPQLPARRASIHLADDDTILRRLRRYGGTPAEIYDHPDLLAALLPSLRRDFAVSETYRYTDPTLLACSTTAFGGEDDDAADAASVDAWREVVEGKFRSHTFPGGHFYWSDDAGPLLAEISSDLRWRFADLLDDPPRRQ
jgi:medium-chain acyl-[acyl-carrier-protein] hydrolase